MTIMRCALAVVAMGSVVGASSSLGKPSGRTELRALHLENFSYSTDLVVDGDGFAQNAAFDKPVQHGPSAELVVRPAETRLPSTNTSSISMTCSFSLYDNDGGLWNLSYEVHLYDPNDNPIGSRGDWVSNRNGVNSDLLVNLADPLVEGTYKCTVDWWVEDFYLGQGEDTVTLRVCGDERSNIIEGYRAGQVSFTPSCNDFRNSGGSTHFSWSELNGGFSSGNPHDPWGIVTSGLTSGLEDTRSNYNRGGILLSSGYRCPHGNGQVGGVQQSWHMHGRAGDMYSSDHGWTQTEFNLLRAAAESTGPAELFFWNTYPDRHLHAAW